MKIADDRGFTLIELVVSMAVMGIVVTAAFAMYSAVKDSWSLGSKKFEVLQNARIAADRIVSETRSAYSATVNQGRLELDKPGGQKVSFYLSGRNIIRKSSGIGDQLANYVETLMFFKEGNLIKINICTKLETVSYSIQTAAALRGKCK